MRAKEFIFEKWSDKYKRSINCANPKGFSQKAHCQGRNKNEGIDIGKEWMSDTELDQYVPDQLQQQWRELLGYDSDGNPSALWANLTGGYEPDVNDPEHRALMVKIANKWFASKKIPNVIFFDVKDTGDELEWLVQIGDQTLEERKKKRKPKYAAYGPGPYGWYGYDAGYSGDGGGDGGSSESIRENNVDDRDELEKRLELLKKRRDELERQEQELARQEQDITPKGMDLDTGSDPVRGFISPREKRDIDQNPGNYKFGSTERKDPNFRKPIITRDDPKNLMPRGYRDFGDPPPGMKPDGVGGAHWFDRNKI